MAARRLSPLVVFMSAVFALPSSAYAQWQLNGGLVCSTPATQSSPRVVADGLRGSFVVWQDNRSGSYDIYAQRLNASGVTQWAADGVPVCTAPFDQGNATLVGDGVGGVVISWEDPRNSGGGSMDIYAQRLDSLGTPLWSPDGVTICTASGTQQAPTLLTDSADGGIIAWQDFRSGSRMLYTQRVDRDGVRLWSPDGIAVSTGSNQSNPDMVSDGSGGFVVAWEDYRVGSPDIYMQRISSGGVRAWSTAGLAVCVASGSQTDPKIVLDISGSTTLAWEDFRTGGSARIFAQRMTPGGLPAWTDNGVDLCAAANNRELGCLTLDGSGGAIATWSDTRNLGQSDLYAQRVNVFGVPQWTINGIAICNAPGNQTMPKAVGGGSGGFLLAWTDSRFGSSDVFAQHVLTDGSSAWTANGRPFSKQGRIPSTFSMASDGADGVAFVWEETRYVDSDIYGQKILADGRSGYFMNLAATIAAVQDVPRDQGGWLNVQVSSAVGDPDELEPFVTGYNLWRRASTPGSNPLTATQTSSILEFADRSITSFGWLSAPIAAAAGFPPGSWVSLGFNAATQSSSYTILAPTREDSTASALSSEVFVVTVHTSDPAIFTVSTPDSGHSVDNLPPQAPAMFSAQYDSGVASLHWAPNTENDLSSYVLHRGMTASFVPEHANLVASPSDTGYVDISGIPCYYKLAAVDVHGNVSSFSTVLPSGTTAVDDGATLRFAINNVRPNPATTIIDVSFTLTSRGAATLELLDVAGRRVALQNVGSLGTGNHVVNLAKGRGLAAGIYLVRLRQLGDARTARVVVVN